MLIHILLLPIYLYLGTLSILIISNVVMIILEIIIDEIKGLIGIIKGFIGLLKDVFIRAINLIKKKERKQ